MTTEEFLRLIRNEREQFDWMLTADTGHHAERRAKPRFQLQALAKAMPDVPLDPIRAAVYARSGAVADTWIEAAEALELDPGDAGALAGAANDRTWTDRGGRRMPVVELMVIRQRLLEAVGLAASWMPDARLSEKSDFSHGVQTPKSD